MSDIKFTCPHCQQPLEAPPDMAGETINCPSCPGTMRIPGNKTILPKQRKLLVIRHSTPPVVSNEWKKTCKRCGTVSYIDKALNAQLVKEYQSELRSVVRMTGVGICFGIAAILGGPSTNNCTADIEANQRQAKADRIAERLRQDKVCPKCGSGEVVIEDA